jgi:pilus assembly protein Flp/PilA
VSGENLFGGANLLETSSPYKSNLRPDTREGSNGSVDFQSFGTGDRKMLKIRKFIKNNKGATAIEYGLIAALIAVAMITAVSRVGGGVGGTFNIVADNMNG